MARLYYLIVYYKYQDKHCYWLTLFYLYAQESIQVHGQIMIKMKTKQSHIINLTL